MRQLKKNEKNRMDDCLERRFMEEDGDRWSARGKGTARLWPRRKLGGVADMTQQQKKGNWEGKRGRSWSCITDDI